MQLSLQTAHCLNCIVSPPKAEEFASEGHDFCQRLLAGLAPHDSDAVHVTTVSTARAIVLPSYLFTCYALTVSCGQRSSVQASV